MIMEKLQSKSKNNHKKQSVVLEKWLPLQCFNKRMIVLQI